MPVLKDQQLRSIMTLHQTTPHKWSLGQLPLIEEVAERVWNAIEHAHAQAQRRRAEEMVLQGRGEESERLRRLFARAPGFMAICAVRNMFSSLPTPPIGA